ncbi:carbohydrate ABC transporter permease [Jonesia denitrificans]|uniref:Binding-protein-dependent transport systems inner membrane component n=1 Tax=Jonesia denitrificans (strain ATCC 14870 / DSM 20603 / BCRC 15368 / CIP 55.134 / JCM 11481 / NBRC 15587 / NCTC 10816 / Prevot 55134) TaxID=471856 RepID=C7QZ72_JONDD|nr:carbohydrate ABC transporter permease [Jonesia denitrificans]ACV07980.1 binding-protein-dependent transport systems inner membrane component [Jonesia denitrificans DSM 20603]ASE08328.1 carbohydrate ABC transporter permease [Jonesia denitrificans]QXB42927.1 carbohydrate ABC transporter permease [Jonesia denitrificans]SQH19955.1 Inner membrane ABC transporter permease protein ycjP [Jonesia denitrificans]
MKERPSYLSTGILLLGALYCLLPVIWVVMASTKGANELFSTFTFAPSTHLFDNIAELSAYRDGLFWTWMWNTALYAGVGGVASTLVSASAGYGLAKYTFAGKGLIFKVLLAGVLVPAVVLAIPQYLLLAEINMTNTYWSVLLPSIISPYGIYLARIYAGASVPNDVIEAARTDGAGEARTFFTIALPMMAPALVTIFLFQFVAIWNNYMLPFIMLGNDQLYPLTVGLSGLLNQGASQPAMYTSVITGALLSIIPLIALFFLLQRYWKVDFGGAVKG